MSNTIQIKRGSGAPGANLAPYELGYDVSGEYLYIGQSKADGTSDNAKKIKAGYADAAGTATKIVDANGTAQTVGSGTEPIYLSNGEFFPCGGDATISGTSEYAKALNPGAKIGADLTKNESVDFTGAQSIVIGVTGTLPVTKGGTGVNSDTALKMLVLNMTYPVGSIYMSTVNNSPENFLGGKWMQIEDTFLLAAGSTYAAGATGGKATHTHEYGFVAGENYGFVSLFPPSNTTNLTTDYKSGVLDSEGSPVGWTKRTEQTGGSSTDIDLTLKTNTSYNTGSNSIKQESYESKGETSSTSNMPPYLAVYMWKRTA